MPRPNPAGGDGLSEATKQANARAERNRQALRDLQKQRQASNARAEAKRQALRKAAAQKNAPVQAKPARQGLGIPDLLSSPVQAQPAGQGPPRPKPKPKPKTWQERLWNDARYEFTKGDTGRLLRRVGDQIVGDAKASALAARANPLTVLVPRYGYVERNAATAVVGAVDNFARFIYSHGQRAAGAKKADPTAGPIGETLQALAEGTYRALGSKPPSQMTQAELNRDELRRGFGADLVSTVLLGGPVLQLATGAAKATTVAGTASRAGVAWALTQLGSQVFQNPTGGNLANLANQYGANLPGAIDVGQDDWVDSFWKSLLPNAGADLLVGGAAGAGVGAAKTAAKPIAREAGRSLKDLGVPLRNTKAHLRRRWMARAEDAERAAQEATDTIRRDPEGGGYGFPPQEPMAEPSTGSAASAPGSYQPPPMPGQAAPEFDPWVGAYDPALPTSTTLGRAIGDLSDSELRAIFGGDGPVAPRVEDALAAREQITPMPSVPAQILPTGVLPDDYLATLPNKWRGMADGDKPFDLAPLFDPEVNPLIWKRAQALTGADDPGQLTPTDMADVLDAMLEEGQAVIPSRMGADMVPVADIRRPVPAADPATLDPSSDPWSTPTDMPDMPEQLFWDPRSEGTITIKDGPVGPEVVDGNKRLGLAQRLGVEQVPVARDGAQPPDSPPEPRPVLELDPAERARMKQELIKQAAANGEIRPPDSPIPAFSDMPARRLDEVDMDKPVVPGSPEAQALADEVRFGVEALREQAGAERAAKEAQRDAQAYELKTFEQKKAEGLTRGYKVDRGEGQAPPAQGGAAGPVAPERPVSVRLSVGSGEQPEFQLPPAIKKLTVSYGSRKVRFASDLDRAAYTLLDKKNPKLAPELRAALEAAGIDMGALVNHGIRVRKALKSSGPSGDGAIDLPAQPWGTGDDFSVSSEPGIAVSGDAQGGVDGLGPLTMEQVAERASVVDAAIRSILGQEVEIRYKATYSSKILPEAWGGDGVKKTNPKGSYNAIDDVVKVYGLADPERVTDSYVRVGYHESWHRIQRVSLGTKEAAVMDTWFARLKTAIADVESSQFQKGVKAYSETQADAFSHYAMLRRSGLDPVEEIAERFAAAVGRDLPESIREVFLAFANYLDRVLDYSEKVYNLVRNGTFDSTKDLFDRVYGGRYVGTDDLEAWAQPNSGAEMMSKSWKGRTWNNVSLRSRIEAVRQANRKRLDSLASEAQRIRDKARSGGCL